MRFKFKRLHWVLAAAGVAAVVLPVGSSASASHVPKCLDETPTLVGTAGDDVLVGTSDDDVIVGLEGNDTSPTMTSYCAGRAEPLSASSQPSTGSADPAWSQPAQPHPRTSSPIQPY